MTKEQELPPELIAAVKTLWDELYKLCKPFLDIIEKYNIQPPPPRPFITWNDGMGGTHKTFVDEMRPEDQAIIRDFMKPIGHISIGKAIPVPDWWTDKDWEKLKEATRFKP